MTSTLTQPSPLADLGTQCPTLYATTDRETVVVGDTVTFKNRPATVARILGSWHGTKGYGPIVNLWNGQPVGHVLVRTGVDRG